MPPTFSRAQHIPLALIAPALGGLALTLDGESKKMLSPASANSTPVRVSRMPRNASGLVRSALETDDCFGAFRLLATVLSGRYVPERALYATIWEHMLERARGAAAVHCYEMLKLLQTAFPPSQGGEGRAQPWYPYATAAHPDGDWEVFLECLKHTRPRPVDSDVEQDDAAPTRRNSSAQKQQKKKKATTTPTAKGTKRNKPSPGDGPVDAATAEAYHLVLSFFVAMLADEARRHEAAGYAEAAVVRMLFPGGDATRWFEVATIVVEAIGSLQLSRAVSDTYFALLALLVPVCGHGANRLRHDAVMLWLVQSGVALLECNPVFTDSLAELLLRADWWLHKLDFVNRLLMQKFLRSDVKGAGKEYVDDAKTLNPALAGERLCLVYFYLRPYDRQSQSSQQESFDSETLVILVSSAWQCALSLRQSHPHMWRVVQQRQEEVWQGLEAFTGKVKRLASMRGNSQETSQRTSWYMTLLQSMVHTLLVHA